MQALRAPNGTGLAFVSNDVKSAAELVSHEGADKKLICQLQHELSVRRGQERDPHAQAQLEQAQRHLDALIVRVAAPLRGIALKDFVKDLWPDNEQRIANSRRLLSFELQSEFATHSKRLRRDAGMPARFDVAASLEKALDFLRRAGMSAGENAATERRMSAQGLSWMATRLNRGDEQQKALEKAHEAYERIQDKTSAAAQKELGNALCTIAEGIGNLKTDALRAEAQQILDQHLPAAAAGARIRILSLLGVNRFDDEDVLAVIEDVRALRISSPLEEQQAALAHVKVLAQHTDSLSLEARAALAQALAQAFLTRITLNSEFSQLRTHFVGTAVRNMADDHVPPQGFDREKLVADFGAIAQRQEEGKDVGKAQTRDGKVIPIEGIDNYVKSIKYRNVRAAEEMLMTRLLALTGMDCPNICLGQNAQRHFLFDEETRNDYHEHKDEPANFTVVASEMVYDFKELGPLVLDKQRMLPLIRTSHGEGGVATYEAAVKKFTDAFTEEKRLDRQQPKDTDENDPITRQKQEQRKNQFEAMTEIYALWPDSLKNLAVKAQYMARLINDDDFLNFGWKNFGFRCPSDDPDTWRPFGMDEGNAGTAGFGGMQVQNSLERANRRARLDDPYKPNRLLPRDATFNGYVGDSRSGAASVGRNMPSIPIIGEVIRAEARMFDLQGDGGKIPEHEKRHFAGQMEAAYQMSFIPDAAFLHVAKESWPYLEKEFTPTEGDEPKLSPEQYARIMQDRRDSLVNKFSPEELAEWAERNPKRALAAYSDVSAAVAAMTGLHVEPRVQAGSALPATV